MNAVRTVDADLGELRWNEELKWWEGSVKLESASPFKLYVFSREPAGRLISVEARHAFRRLRSLEFASRRYAAAELTAIHNDEWSHGRMVSEPEFARRLSPDSIEIHESGYAEFHFKADELFSGHGVGVRVQPDGGFQEAVVEG